MESVLVRWSTIHRFGDLWYQHHQIRKSLFVDDLGWNVPHNSEAEWDQYDTANTLYVITHAGGRVLASSRLLPGDVTNGAWTTPTVGS